MRQINDSITKIIAQLLDLTNVSQSKLISQRLWELQESYSQSDFLLVILGQFKRGKTSLINALLGEALLPTALVPLTSIITVIKPSEKLDITVQLKNGQSIKIKREQLPEYVTETGNPNNQKSVERVVVEYPHTNWLKAVTLVDTPGVGSVFKHNTDVAYEYVPKADAGIFVVSPDPPISAAELNFLTTIKDYLGKLIFVQNKADQFNAAEQKESLTFTQNTIRSTLGKKDIPIYPVSAKLGLKGKLEHQDKWLEESGMKDLEAMLEQLIQTSRQQLLNLSYQKKLSIIIKDIQVQLAIRQQTASFSVDSLRQKVAEFQTKTGEIQETKEDTDALINAKIEKLVGQTLLDDIETFKTKKLPQLLIEFERFYRQNQAKPNQEFLVLFKQFLTESIKTMFNEWREMEQEKLKVSLESTLSRFADETNQSINELIALSESLFQVKLDTMNVSVNLIKNANFRFGFDEYILDLDLFTPTVSRLPSLIAKKLLYPKLKEQVVREFDRHSGRSRYDFQERVLTEVRRYQEDLDQRFTQILVNFKEGTTLALKTKSNLAKQTNAVKKALIQEEKVIRKLSTILKQRS